MHAINADEKVMKFFPEILSKEQTNAFVKRMKEQFDNKGFSYFAVDKLEDNEFIGFIGLSEETYEADFTPCIDIGWRIKSSQWNKGYASESARKCLDYALTMLKIENVYAIAPIVNLKSEYIMVKIGMEKQREFEHPLLKDFPKLKTCVLYRTKRKNENS